MADFPDTIYSPREIENLPGIVYDAGAKKTFFAEDLNNTNDEIVAIETFLMSGNIGKEPLTNGDIVSPEILFAAGDVIMV